jgi:hypothetical protein
MLILLTIPELFTYANCHFIENFSIHSVAINLSGKMQSKKSHY